MIPETRHDVDRERTLWTSLARMQAQADIVQLEAELDATERIYYSVLLDLSRPWHGRFLLADVFPELFRKLMVEVTFRTDQDYSDFFCSESDALERCKELKAALSNQVNVDIHTSPGKITLVLRLRP